MCKLFMSSALLINELTVNLTSLSMLCTCSLKLILYTFSVLCVMLSGSMFMYVFHVNYRNDTFQKQTFSQQNSVRKDNCSVCFEHNFNYVIDNENICKRKGGDPQIELIVFIFTSHNRKLQRDTIRRTWISYAKNNGAHIIRYAFLLGGTHDINLSNAVLEENEEHHDIIKEDFTDAYSNLTYKTMMAYKYASTKCKDVKYVMKTDDDVYVNIPAVFNVIKVHGTLLQTAVGGACHISARPIRSKSSKWFVSLRSYPHSHYPGFCSGTGYITSQHVAAKVYQVSKHVPFFHLEDVYVALCIQRLGNEFKLKRIRGFNSGLVTPDACTYSSDSMVTSHRVPPSMIEQLWQGKCNMKKYIIHIL